MKDRQWYITPQGDRPLLATEASVHAQNVNDITALQIASLGDIETINKLLQLGVDVEAHVFDMTTGELSVFRVCRVNSSSLTFLGLFVGFFSTTSSSLIDHIQKHQRS